MRTVIVDDDLRARLQGMTKQLQICDESGQWVGEFIPESVIQQWTSEWATLLGSEDEIHRRGQEPGFRHLYAAWKRMNGRAD